MLLRLMIIKIKLKFLFYQNQMWLLIVSLLFVAAVLIIFNEPLATTATILGSVLSLIYFVQKQKLEELNLFRELFKEFNARYDGMNEKLSKIVTNSNDTISDDESDLLVDYFNLCGEEYFYYRKGYIDPIVWESWFNGMLTLLANQKIYNKWLTERQTISYYGLDNYLIHRKYKTIPSA